MLRVSPDDRRVGMSGRVALAEFLKSRRERLTPVDVGLPVSSRRRVRGLRREEVALLADIGIVWYTWLEQGRPINVSDDALSRIAAALRLSDQERIYFQSLAGGHDARRDGSAIDVPPHILDLLALYDAGPGYVLDPRWNVIAWNEEYARLYAMIGAGSVAPHNMLRLAFGNPAMQGMIVDWPDAARRFVAMFRADYARYAGDVEFERLIETLCRESAEFDELWAEIAMESPTDVVVNRILDPQRGEREERIVTLQLPEMPGYALVFHVPHPGIGEHPHRRMPSAE
jgi:transcriptional regulator with XRE-family HTH domain